MLGILALSNREVSTCFFEDDSEQERHFLRDRTVFLGTDQIGNGSFPKYLDIIIEIDVGVSTKVGGVLTVKAVRPTD
jgi:hypothetical protein